MPQCTSPSAGAGSIRPSPSSVPGVARVPGDDRAVLGERHQLEVRRRHIVAGVDAANATPLRSARLATSGDAERDRGPAQEVPSGEVTAGHGRTLVSSAAERGAAHV